jgi:hypothetical protein
MASMEVPVCCYLYNVIIHCFVNIILPAVTNVGMRMRSLRAAARQQRHSEKE